VPTIIANLLPTKVLSVNLNKNYYQLLSKKFVGEFIFEKPKKCLFAEVPFCPENEILNVS